MPVDGVAVVVVDESAPAGGLQTVNQGDLVATGGKADGGGDTAQACADDYGMWGAGRSHATSSY